MIDEIPHPSPEDLVAEGEALVKRLPYCHKSLNDLTAATLICKMHAVGGFDVSLEELEECIQRIRIRAETGVYPDELLEQAEAKSPLQQKILA